MTPTEQADESGTLKDKKLRIVNRAIGVLKMNGMTRLKEEMEAAKVIIESS